MIYLNLELTDLCNLRCVMCGQAAAEPVHDSPDRMMRERTWRRALEGLAELDEPVSLCPHWLGDPTVHPRFASMLRWAFAHNAGNRLFRHFKLHTNGVLLDRDGGVDTLLDCAARADQAADTFQFVHLSLDAVDRQVYRRVKGVDARDDAYRNARALLERRRARGLQWPKLTAAFVVMEDNRDDARPFLDHWRELFAGLGVRHQETWDWPVEALDTIYFRGLNWRDQDAADRLHREVLAELGLVAPGEDVGTMPGSF